MLHHHRIFAASLELVQSPSDYTNYLARKVSAHWKEEAGIRHHLQYRREESDPWGPMTRSVAVFQGNVGNG